MSVASVKRRTRLNTRAIIAIIIIVLVLTGGLAGLWVFQNRSLLRNWIQESQKFEEAGDFNQPLSCLDECLKRSPNHPEAARKQVADHVQLNQAAA